MIDRLIYIDMQLLIAINSLNATWADTLMLWISNRYVWIPLYLLLSGMLCQRYGWKKGLILVICMGISVGLADYISSGIIKHHVCRLRPTHEPLLEGMVHIVNNYKSSLYGFVSSHAANTMALSLLFSLIWKNRYVTFLLMLWTMLNCYSRMYLGVHYPGDILGGLIVGSVIALLMYWILCRVGWLQPAAGSSCKK